jgi:hypothetical protein
MGKVEKWLQGEEKGRGHYRGAIRSNPVHQAPIPELKYRIQLTIFLDSLVLCDEPSTTLFVTTCRPLNLSYFTTSVALNLSTILGVSEVVGQ